MDKRLEKLESLFKKNEEWVNENPFTPGDKNPYPDKIQDTFIKWYLKNYVMEVSYVTPEDGPVTVTVDREDDIRNATSHAYFDCADVESCIDLLESWVKDYYEYTVFDDWDDISDLTVRSIKK